MKNKAFTLFELIVVVILVSIVYYITFSNLDIKQKKLNTITLTNIKQKLLEYDFNSNIAIKCLNNENIDCLLIVDNLIQQEKIENLFKSCPNVYEYSKDIIQIEYLDLELDQFKTADVCFEFEVSKNQNSSQIIVETSNDVYIYDNISLKPKKLKFINDVSFYFEEKENEVRDAF